MAIRVTPVIDRSITEFPAIWIPLAISEELSSLKVILQFTDGKLVRIAMITYHHYLSTGFGAVFAAALVFDGCLGFQ